MKKLILITFLITIVDPYSGLDYEEINVYEYDTDYQIKIVEPEKEKEKKPKTTIYCFICDPPQYIEI